MHRVDNRNVTPEPDPQALPGAAGKPVLPVGLVDPVDPVDPVDRLRGRLMAAALGSVLNKARGAREVLPHLAALERALTERGAMATGQVPPHWLGRICSQLSSLPLPADDPALKDLLTRLRDRLQAEHADWMQDDSAESERTVVIREITHSEFAAAENELATTVATPRL